MNELDIPYHLAIPTFVCIGILLLFFFKRRQLSNSKYKLFWISATVFLTIYSFIVGSAMIDNIRYKRALYKYDLDKDGFFGGKELTPELEAASFRLANDVGRNFSIFTGTIFAGIISIATYILGKIIQRIFAQKLTE
jgi:hypothetical protein